MSRRPTPLHAYIDREFGQEDALLAAIRARGEALRPGMQISSGEGSLLHLLAKLIPATRILEIGSFVGYSACRMAAALPAQGELITLEADAAYATIARDFFAQSSLPITLIEGAAKDTIATLSGPFDLIFIDADKQHYIDYLHLSAPLLRSGGLMIGDNSLLFGAMHGQPRQRCSAAAIASMQAFNHHLAHSGEYDAALIPTTEGLTVARKR